MGLTSKILGLPFIRLFAGRQRGRLVRDYFFISVLLVGGGLITSGLVEIYFRYQESREQLGLVQQEVAAGAAFKIERFVQEIHNTLKAATRSRDIAPKGLTPEFRFELEKLLLIAPAVTEAIALDENGAMRVQASRLRTVLPDSKRNLSLTPSFRQAMEGKSYFGPVHFVRGSEPYMTIAVPIERFAGDVIGVLQAEVNLKYIGDVISSITVGKAGYAYAVTRTGELIAHPDISLVLQRRNVGELDQVKEAFRTSIPAGPNLNALLVNNLQGNPVLTSSALIPSLDWAVILERPAEEAYEPLYASMMRTSALLLVGLAMAVMASIFLARRIVRPVGILRQGVERIGAGDLSYRLELKTGDEIEVLAEEFNRMTAQLRESYANLEQKVEDRTRALSESLEQQTATSEVLKVISRSAFDLQTVLGTLIENATKLCGADQGYIHRLEGDVYSLAVSYGATPEFKQFLERNPTRTGDRDNLLGRVVAERRPVHIPDVLTDPRYKWTAAQSVGGFRTLLGIPMLREGVPIGVIVIWRKSVQPFTGKQIDLVTTFADQAVIAIENVRLFREIQEKNDQLENANRHKSQFLANVSHELRTPLNSIIGFTRLVLRKTEGQIEKLQKENLQKVLISSEHLLNLINGLLDLAKIEAGRMEVYAETFSVNDVIRLATSTVEPLLKNGRVRLIAEVAPDIPPLTTDRDKLKQAILNLLSNAVKFTEEGEIKVAAWQVNGTLKLVISDTGIGMKREALHYIFEEFRQADMSSTRKYSGTGLGLTIVKKFVNLMGGEIVAESQEGKGSKFTISLPVEYRRQ